MISTQITRVEFHGEHIPALQGPDGTVWTPVQHWCDALGLERSAQQRRLQRQPWAGTAVMAHETPAGPRQHIVMDLRTLPLWLATVQVSRVRPEARARLALYQREAAEVLARHFLDRAAPAAVQGSGPAFTDAELEAVLAVVRAHPESTVGDLATALGVGEVGAARLLVELRRLSLVSVRKGHVAAWSSTKAVSSAQDEIALQGAVLTALQQGPMSGADLRDVLRVRRQRLQPTLESLQRAGRVRRVGAGPRQAWVLVVGGDA